MSGDYIDDEDLINDYIEEEDFSPEYDDAFMEEMEQEVTNTRDKSNEKNADPPPALEPTPTSTTEHPEPQPTMPPQEITTTTTQNWSELREKKTDLFKFERFQGMQQWRREPDNSADAMVANSWKRPNGLHKQNGLHPARRSTATTPEAQLVQALVRNQNEKVFLTKYQTKQYLPKEGISSVAVTLSDGTRIHVKQNSKLNTKELLGAKSSKGNILGVSMKELMRRSDAIRRKKERLERYQRSKNEKEETEDTPSMMDEDDQKTEQHDHQLWVDKHAPTAFSHLLSDERTNREVLRALRAWDRHVFHRDPPPRPTIVQQFQQKQQQSSPKQNTNVDSPTAINPNDSRPDESNRVILLSGPPGVGKTTLAHIVARHAGYRPLEVNSSDERSAGVLKERVVRAMESSTLNLQSSTNTLMGRPNCLILDEIDGADAKGAVAALVEIIRAEMPTTKKSATYLRRPIIFICNHKYAPALRPLLPYAKQFDVGPPSVTRLVARLRAVLSEEKLSLRGGSTMLHQLVAGSGGDIRSCLYTLQFASARAKEIGRGNKLHDNKRRGATVVDISKALGGALGATGNGLKDEQNDVAGTITAVFRKPKKQRLEQRLVSSSVVNKKAEVERVLGSVENFGDNSKTLDCIFMNLLRVSYVDPTLDRCFAAHEWLSGADIYRSSKTSVASNNSAVHHSMQRFHIPSAAAAVHFLCRVETKADLLFSTRQMSDSWYQLEANTGLVQKFVEGLAPKSRAGAVGSNVVTETIPYSLWLLSAGQGSCSLNRAVSSLEILNTNERIAFNAHVATLRALGLTYVATEQASEGFAADVNVKMRLEPQIDRIVEFEDAASEKRRREIPSVLKELLAHGAALQGMREREAVVEKEQDARGVGKTITTKTATTSVDLFKNTEEAKWKPSAKPSPNNAKHKILDTAIEDPPAKRPKTLRNAGTNFLGIGAARAKAAKTARKAALVGFDRTKKVKLSNSGSGVEFKQVVRFKFSRGFTQAVRTPCRLEDLM